MTGLALSGPDEPVLYVVGALVPLALLLVYWLWLEPRAEADRLRAHRLRRAVEDAFELTERQTDPSAPPDVARRAFYDQLDLSDLFEADHIEASSVLGKAFDEGTSLRARLDTEKRALPGPPRRHRSLGKPGRETRSRSHAGRRMTLVLFSPPDRHEPL